MSRRTKGWLIAAASLILVGCILFTGVMTVLKWNFRKLATDEYETNTYTLTAAFTNVSVDVRTADVVFAPSADGSVSVVCYEEIKTKHTVAVEGDTLVIQAPRTKWYRNMGVHLDGPKITVYLPAGTYDNLMVTAITGDVTIPDDFSFASADVNVTTGDIIGSANVAGAMTLHVTTGDVALTGVTCGDLTVGATTGDVKLKNVIASGAFSIKCSTGNVTFDACDAATLKVKVTTGNIIGTLLTAKVFDAHATTGNVSVPQTTTGGKCKLSATTGNIRITIQ